MRIVSIACVLVILGCFGALLLVPRASADGTNTEVMRTILENWTDRDWIAIGAITASSLLLVAMSFRQASVHKRLKKVAFTQRQELERVTNAIKSAESVQVAINGAFGGWMKESPALELQKLERALSEAEHQATELETMGAAHTSISATLRTIGSRQQNLIEQLSAVSSEDGIVGKLQKTKKWAGEIDELVESIPDEVRDADELTRKMDELSQGADEAEETTKEIEKRVPRITALQERAKNLTTRMTPLADINTGIDALLTDISDDLDNIDSDLEEIKGDEDVESRIDTLEERAEELGNEVDSLGEQMERLNTLKKKVSRSEDNESTS